MTTQIIFKNNSKLQNLTNILNSKIDYTKHLQNQFDTSKRDVELTALNRTINNYKNEIERIQFLINEEYNNGIKGYTIIASAELAGLTDYENKQRTIDFEFDLNIAGRTFKKCKGCYKGLSEASFLFCADSFQDARNLIKNILKDYKQESVLLRVESGVYLYFQDGKIERIGNDLEFIGKINKIDITTIDNCTVIDDSVYIVK